MSDEAKDLVRKLLTYDPNKRMSALEAYNHPWIKEVASDDRINKDEVIRTLKNL